MDMGEKDVSRILILGGGIGSSVGNVHRTALRIVGNNQVIGGCFSRDQEINKESQIWWSSKNRLPFFTLEDCLTSSESFDTVLILTPPNQHARAILKFLDQGKNIITEKPLIGNFKDLDNLVESIDVDSDSLLTTYNYSGYPMVRELRQIIKKNLLGEIFNVRIEMYQDGFLKRGLDGEPFIPQNWRLEDDEIPTVSLDLGTHVLHLLYFLIGELPVRGHAISASNGHFKVIDQVDFIGQDRSGRGIRLGWGKSSLGFQNGLKVEVFGEKGAATWIQMNPEALTLSNEFGEIKSLLRGNPSCLVANEARYTRFKGGHPSGFIEAFANLYEDLLFKREGRDFVQENYGISTSKVLMSTLFKIHEEWM
jgi:predicted dehydrogenase